MGCYLVDPAPIFSSLGAATATRKEGAWESSCANWLCKAHIISADCVRAALDANGQRRWQHTVAAYLVRCNSCGMLERHIQLEHLQAMPHLPQVPIAIVLIVNKS